MGEFAFAAGRGYFDGMDNLPTVDAQATPVGEPVVCKLTEKQLAFVEHYVRHRNATQAYDHAYDARGGSYETRRDAGSLLLRRPHIQAAIAERQKLATQESCADVGWLLGRFLAIATADPRELIGLKVGCCRYCHGEGHGYQWREREYMEAVAKVEQLARLEPHRAAALEWPDIGGGFGFNATLEPVQDCPQCHGEGLERFVPRDTDKLSDEAVLLYGGVKVKKDGYEIIIADRGKALELAGRIMGAFTDNLRVKASIGALVGVADLAKMDPSAAAKTYRDFVAGNLTA